MLFQRLFLTFISLMLIVSCSQLQIPPTEDQRKERGIMDYKYEDPNHLLPSSFHPYSTYSTWFDSAIEIRRVMLADLLKHSSESEWKLLALWIFDPSGNQPKVVALRKSEAKREYQLFVRRSATPDLHWDERKISEVKFVDFKTKLDKKAAEVIHKLWLLATSRAREPTITPTGVAMSDGWSSYFISFDANSYTPTGIGETITPSDKNKISFRLEEFASLLENYAVKKTNSESSSHIIEEAIRLINDIEKDG